MYGKKYVIGVDFGTESGAPCSWMWRPARRLPRSVHAYGNSVMSKTLPESGVRLEPDWALQDPNN